MGIAYRDVWKRLGWVDRAFLVLVILYVLMRVTHWGSDWLLAVAMAGLVCGAISLGRLSRLIMRKAIWRLRNRLIVAYVFIAFVPIVLILTLACLSCYVLIGQVAAYFVRTELANQESFVVDQADTLAGNPVQRRGRGLFPGFGRGGRRPGPSSIAIPGNGKTPVSSPPQAALSGGAQTPGAPRPPGAPPQPGTFGGRDLGGGRGGRGGPPGGQQMTGAELVRYLGGRVRNNLPGAEILVRTNELLRIPEESTLGAPPAEFGRVTGLVVKNDEKNIPHLYIWAHVLGSTTDVREVTVMYPVTSAMLSRLDPRLSSVAIPDYVEAARDSKIPPPANIFDLRISGLYALPIANWDDPKDSQERYLWVYSRISAVLGIIFEEKAGQETLTSGVQAGFIAIAALFLFVEIASLWAGVRLTQSMTGAVHEIYEGTRRVQTADFSYRIPVRGNDQLAEMASSFNAMTEHLGELIVVAKEKERLQSELEIAHEVQAQLFPRDVPKVESLELKGVCRPARVVSGDYYDFLVMPGSELAFAIGDVAGKGISAALLMATIQSAVRTQLSNASGSSPRPLSAAALVAQLNVQLYANTAPEKYATFFLALYDEPSRRLTYANAGHLPPILVRKGQCSSLPPTGTVVGAFPFSKFEERSIVLEEGDLLVAYTDGIVEPENSYGEMFGEDRLQELLLRYAFADSSEIIARTMESVVQWTGSPELQDDMTMIVVRRT